MITPFWVGHALRNRGLKFAAKYLPSKTLVLRYHNKLHIKERGIATLCAN
jgi:hypothetical protein